LKASDNLLVATVPQIEDADDVHTLQLICQLILWFVSV